MSACISRHGEYSSHVHEATGDHRFVCARCWVLDEDAILAALEVAEAERDAALFAAASDAPLIEVRDRWKAALAREGNLASAVADVVWKAAQYGETEDGDTFAYIVPKGAMHRLVGVAQSNGAHVPVSFRAALAAVAPSGPLFRTPDDWCELFGVIVLDPDGWRSDMQSWDQPVTREEFNRRANMSTIGPRSLLSDPQETSE